MILRSLLRPLHSCLRQSTSSLLRPSYASVVRQSLPSRPRPLFDSFSTARHASNQPFHRTPNPRQQYTYHRFGRASQFAALWRQSPLVRTVVYTGAGGAGVFVVTNLEQVPGSGRWRFNWVSPSYERASGEEGYRALLHEYRGKLLPANHPEVRLARRVVQRLLPHAGLTEEELKGWEVHVIDDPGTVNAFVIPGGKVFVFRGILPLCRDEEGLAAVLSHEIAHNTCHHVAEGISRRTLLIPLVLLIELFFQLPGQFTLSAANLAIELPGSRAQESEADWIGLMMMSRACYKPEEAKHMWERMDSYQRKHGGYVPGILSTHPTNERRIRDITSWLPKAEDLRTESNCGPNMVQWNQGFKSALSSKSLPQNISSDDDDSFW